MKTKSIIIHEDGERVRIKTSSIDYIEPCGYGCRIHLNEDEWDYYAEESYGLVLSWLESLEEEA